MTAPLSLRPIVEAQDLPRMQVAELRERFARGQPGVAWSPEYDASSGASLGVLGGPAAAAWPHDIAAAPPVNVPALCAVGEAWWAPAFGALIGADGALYNATIGEARHGSQDLSAIPGVQAGATWFKPPVSAPAIEAGAAFLPWGATFNYGHFLIDALPSLLALEQAGLTAGVPALAPRLTAWQRDLLALALPGVEIREVDAPLARVGRVDQHRRVQEELRHQAQVIGELLLHGVEVFGQHVEQGERRRGALEAKRLLSVTDDGVFHERSPSQIAVDAAGPARYPKARADGKAWFFPTRAYTGRDSAITVLR